MASIVTFTFYSILHILYPEIYSDDRFLLESLICINNNTKVSTMQNANTQGKNSSTVTEKRTENNSIKGKK